MTAKREPTLKELTEALKAASRRIDEARAITKRTGRITPEDLISLLEIRTYDFYDPQKDPADATRFTSAAAFRNNDGTWEVRAMQGPDRDTMTTVEPRDVLGRRKTMQQAVDLLEKFEADNAHLQRAIMRAIDMPHWSRVKAAIFQGRKPFPAP